MNGQTLRSAPAEGLASCRFNVHLEMFGYAQNDKVQNASIVFVAVLKKWVGLSSRAPVVRPFRHFSHVSERQKMKLVGGESPTYVGQRAEMWKGSTADIRIQGSTCLTLRGGVFSKKIGKDKTDEELRRFVRKQGSGFGKKQVAVEAAKQLEQCIEGGNTWKQGRATDRRSQNWEKETNKKSCRVARTEHESKGWQEQ